MQVWLAQLIAALERFDSLGAEGVAALREQFGFVRTADNEELETLLKALAATLPPAPQDPPLPPHREKQMEALAASLLESFWQRYTHGSPQPAQSFSPGCLAQIGKLYRQLKAPWRVRHHLLRALAADGSSLALELFAELAASDPPAEADDASLAFVPLLQPRPDQQPPLAVSALYPRLLDALAHPATAALVLDVSNHFTRQGWLAPHPAHARVAQLADLLSGMVQRLNQLEERPAESAATARQLQQKVADGVSLLVPLCDALALIGDASVTGKLHQALSLGHRRLRTEAAAALARLGDEQGTAALVQLTAEPVVRPIALAYLDELGQLTRAPAQYRTPVARAEGDLARWLSQPTRFGLPPMEMELVDACTQHWPGFDEPVDCFLFRYDYSLPQGKFSGVGIAAPVTYSFYADLQDLPPAEIYAVYAGWSVEHEELTETDAAALSPDQIDAWKERRGQLEEEGYSDLRLAKLGHFFGEDVSVVLARRGPQPGVLVADERETLWYPHRGASRPIGPTEAYYLYKGRKILGAFNRDA